jgi:hypothetical protein
VSVFFQGVAGIQQGFVTDRDSSSIADAEVNTCGFLTRLVVCVDGDFAHEVQFPLFTVPDCTHLLDGFYVGQVVVWTGIVFTEDEITPAVFQVRSFREANLLVFGIELEAVFFERDS